MTIQHAERLMLIRPVQHGIESAVVGISSSIPLWGDHVRLFFQSAPIDSREEFRNHAERRYGRRTGDKTHGHRRFKLMRVTWLSSGNTRRERWRQRNRAIGGVANKPGGKRGVGTSCAQSPTLAASGPGDWC